MVAVRLSALVFRYVDDFAAFQLVSYTYALAFAAGSIGGFVGRGVLLHLIAFLDQDFHVVLAGILDDRVVFLAEDFGHVEFGDEGNHQCHGKDHGYVEEVGYE